MNLDFFTSVVSWWGPSRRVVKEEVWGLLWTERGEREEETLGVIWG